MKFYHTEKEKYLTLGFPTFLAYFYLAFLRKMIFILKKIPPHGGGGGA
jgi:hypothetical protein